MKISALIKKLETIKGQNGDIELLSTLRDGRRIEIVGYNPDIKYFEPYRLSFCQKGGWLVQG
jgi:hypothetical protein